VEQPQQLATCFRLQNVPVGDHEVIAEGAFRLIVDPLPRENLLPARPARHDEGHDGVTASYQHDIVLDLRFHGTEVQRTECWCFAAKPQQVAIEVAQRAWIGGLLEPRPSQAETVTMAKARKIDPVEQAHILSEALPHMQRYDEEIVVVKYGGHAMGEEEMAKSFARDIVLMEQTAINPVVVHGGGPQIGEMLKRLGIKSEFAAGLRITDAATIEIVEMVLAGSINKTLVGYINEAGGKAVGLCGKDGNMVTASKVTRSMVDPDSNIEKVVDLGFVGEPEKVDLTLLNQLIGHELIPVLAPLATSKSGQTFNVNADTFAGAVAGALKAKRLLLLTDVPGVLDKSRKLIPELSVKDARKLIADGTISGGMIPKVETCIYALEQGVQGVVIIDGKMQHAVLLELFTNQGTGTLIHK